MGISTTIIIAVCGAVLFGFVFNGAGGLLLGAVLGFLLAGNIRLGHLLSRMQERLQKYEDLVTAQQKKDTHGKQTGEKLIFTPVEEVTGELAEDSRTTAGKPLSTPPVPDLFAALAPGSAPDPAPTHPQRKKAFVQRPDPTPNSLDRLFNYIQAFFTQGNVVLRVGLVVLFFGVAFLLKYAAERNVMPIELRLMGVALAGLAMLVFGWRLRIKRAGFAFLVQGGGIGILFLTVFAAFKLYDLLLMPLSFGIMLGLVCSSAALALLQNAKSLALFGAAGGFLAPVLLSTSSGNHVALFSYYALLNTGILTIAWFKAWRELNLLGFVFTLGIGTLWGAQAYQPQFFNSTEPFLILFFLMFTIIGVLFAFRQPPQLRGYVDGTLVFGTPIICFTLQAALVKEMEYGMAISALVVSFFYVGLATLLWNKGDDRLRDGMRTLTEAFLALGIIFVTLAVPLALSGSWTAVTWAMEGAALIWVGVRQNRITPRNFGFLLQIGAALFFLASDPFQSGQMLFFNGAYLGSLIISLAALFSSWYLYRAENLRDFEQYHHVLLFVWGIVWWFAAGINELNLQVPYPYEGYMSLLFVGLSCIGMTGLVKRLSWPMLAWPAIGLLPVMVMVALDNIGWYGSFSSQHLFANYGFAVWPLSFLLLYGCLYLSREWLHDRLLKSSHIGGYLLLVLVVTTETAWQVHGFTSGVDSWTFIVLGLVPAAFVRLIQSNSLNRFWPLAEYDSQYQQQGAVILLSLVWVWLLAGCLVSRGNAAPLPFIPLFNPLELSQLIVMLLLFGWIYRHRDFVSPIVSIPVVQVIGGATGFIWLNSVLARAIHQLLGVPFAIDAMMGSRFFQASVSILWGVLSLAMMITAGRRRSWTTWLTGSVLIGITVLKLFLIDLAKSGTIERIVSFLAVGIILMVIGYFSPLPPVQKTKEKEK